MIPKSLFLIVLLFIFLISASPVHALDKDNASSMIVANGIKIAAIDSGDDMVNDGGMSEDGTINIFEATIQPPDIYNDPDIKASTDKTIPIFKNGAYAILFLTGIFCVYQIVFPTHAAETSKSLNNGRQTYYAPKDILAYGRDIAGWFIAGPGLFLLMLYSCAWILSQMDTSILSQVVISSENVSSYIVFALCAKGIKYYMMIREYIITYAMISWYLIGLVFAWKKTRWFGILCMSYTAVQIYSQVFIVAVLIVSVNRIYAGNYSWASDMLALGGMGIFIVLICFCALFFPIIINYVKPGSLKRAVSYVRWIV